MQLFIAKNILSFFDFFYQKKIKDFIKTNLSKNIDLVLDVGAHKGESVKFFNKFLTIKKIISFEPNSSCFRHLKKFKEKYKILNLEIYNKGCGAKNEQKELNVLFESSSSTLNAINLNSKYLKLKKNFFLGFSNGKLYKKETIEIIRLDQFLINKKINHVDLLKIDTEGFEYSVLNGTGDIIKNINYILFEHHYDDMIKKNYTFSNIHDLLISKGFIKVLKLKMPFRKTFEYVYKNTLF